MHPTSTALRSIQTALVCSPFLFLLAASVTSQPWPATTNHTPSPLEVSAVENSVNISTNTTRQSASTLSGLLFQGSFRQRSSVRSFSASRSSSAHTEVRVVSLTDRSHPGPESDLPDNASKVHTPNHTHGGHNAFHFTQHHSVDRDNISTTTRSPAQKVNDTFNKRPPEFESIDVTTHDNISTTRSPAEKVNDTFTESPREFESHDVTTHDNISTTRSPAEKVNDTFKESPREFESHDVTTHDNISTTTRSPTEKVNDTFNERPREFESLDVTTQDLLRCFQATGEVEYGDTTRHSLQRVCQLEDPGRAVHRELFAKQGEMSVAFSMAPRSAPAWLAGHHHCVVKLRVPLGQAVAVAVRDMRADRFQVNVVLQDSRAIVLLNSDHVLAHQTFIATSHSVLLQLCWFDVARPVDMGFTLRFTAVTLPLPRILFQSPTQGAVQTPLYDPASSYPQDFHFPWAVVMTPPDHVIMISFPWGELVGVLTVKSDTSETRYACREYPSASVHATSRLAVTYDSTCTGRYVHWDYLEARSSGFRMNFSFHHVTARPEQLSDGTWNCSVPHWPDFRHHVLCNLQRECGGGEDEVACPYYTPRCGAGFITAGRACLFHGGKLDRRISWLEASDLCVARGGRLATLKTEQDALQVRRILQFNRFTRMVFYIGVFRVTSVIQMWYRTSFQWTDSTIVHNGVLLPAKPSLETNTVTHRRQPSHCGYYTLSGETRLSACDVPASAAAICETIPADNGPPQAVHTLVLSPLRQVTFNVSTVTCPTGHVTHQFLACDVNSQCWSRDEGRSCASSLRPLPPEYTCRDLIGGVPYTLVCDHRADCSDNSDEDFCVFTPCPPETYSCGNSQCIPRDKVCDGWEDCFAASRADEQGCWGEQQSPELWTWYAPPPGLLDVDTSGELVLLAMPEGPHGATFCSDTHVRCPNDGNCLPVYLRCNGVFDCLHHEDEAGCDSSTCPGFYRCRGSAVCLHPSSLCDGYPQCPQHDDELLCDVSCPANCVCRGLAFYCGHSFAVEKYDGLRYLDATGSGLTPSDVTGSPLLIFLSLAECGLTSLDGLALPNLLDLDLSRNQLTSLKTLMLAGVRQVRKVVLSGNVLLRVLDSGQGRHDRLAELDLSGVLTPRLNASLLTHFPGLKNLNLSGSQVERVLDDGFVQLTELRVVDLRGCPVSHVPPVMFQGLRSLQAVYADSFRLCCPALLPADFNVHDCHAPLEEVSSCDDLLGSEAYSAVTFVVALVAIIGNGSSFVFRVFLSKSQSKLGFGVFVTHLSLSDFLMGVYLVFLGVADRAYKGRYLWNDLWWRNSSACKVAGFLSLLSSEVSTFIMCLITLDRFLVLRFPFSRVHFALKSAHLASCVAWLAGVILAAVPLLPVTSHWRFYGHTSICVPLPLTRKDFAGRVYSFSIVIVLNFVLFLFVCCGQLVIYWSVQANAMSAAATSTTRRTQDLTIARRLLAVAMSDFLCWFPIGLLGLLASRGVPIPGEVNVAVAVLVLPLNSALNPFLYTVNVLLERRRLAREERLRKLILSQLSAKG